MYAVNCSKSPPSDGLLLDITKTEDRVYKLSDYKVLTAIKTAIQKQQCLSEFNTPSFMKLLKDESFWQVWPKQARALEK